MNREEIQDCLEELKVRFNTSPKVYQKEDFEILLEILDELVDRI